MGEPSWRSRWRLSRAAGLRRWTSSQSASSEADSGAESPWLRWGGRGRGGGGACPQPGFGGLVCRPPPPVIPQTQGCLGTTQGCGGERKYPDAWVPFPPGTPRIPFPPGTPRIGHPDRFSPVLGVPHHVQRLAEKLFQVETHAVASPASLGGHRKNGGQQVLHLWGGETR